MTTTKRITGRRHGVIRDRVLSANPLCVMCQAEGRTRLATEVDHIIALTNGGDEDPHDDSNRQGLCAPCHEIKTNADLGYTPRVATGLDGWPVETTAARSITARWKRAARG